MAVKKWLVNNFHPPIEHQPAGDESSWVGFTSAEQSRPQLRWSTTASWVGDSVTAARASWHIEQNDKGLEGYRWTARGRECIPQACLRIVINRRPRAHAAGSKRSHMSRGGFYGIDQSATFEIWQENFIRYRAGLGFVHGPLRRAVDKSKARSQNIKGLVLQTVVFTLSRINWPLGTVPWPCPFRNRSMPAFFFF